MTSSGLRRDERDPQSPEACRPEPVDPRQLVVDWLARCQGCRQEQELEELELGWRSASVGTDQVIQEWFGIHWLGIC